MTPEEEIALRKRAQARGLDVVSYAARLLRHDAQQPIETDEEIGRAIEDSKHAHRIEQRQQELATAPSDPESRLANFHRWVKAVPVRPGPSLDTRRETIYE
jgi:hypothetical protein